MNLHGHENYGGDTFFKVFVEPLSKLHPGSVCILQPSFHSLLPAEYLFGVV